MCRSNFLSWFYNGVLTIVLDPSGLIVTLFSDKTEESISEIENEISDVEWSDKKKDVNQKQ